MSLVLELWPQGFDLDLWGAARAAEVPTALHPIVNSPKRHTASLPLDVQIKKRVILGRRCQSASGGGSDPNIFAMNSAHLGRMGFLGSMRGFIRSFDLEPHLIRKADLEGGPMFAIKRKTTAPWIVAGRGKEDSSKIGLDFILPGVPWFQNALDRAEHNMIDFGFGKVPCLTVEDVILSKFFSLKNDPSRFNDLDDLKSIFQANHPLDLAYLAGEMQRLSLVVPAPLKNMAPKALHLVSKKRKKT